MTGGVPAAAAGMRRLRTERGLTLAEAGKLLGVHPSNVLRAESGRLRGWAAEHVAAAYGVEVADLLAPCPHCGGNPPAGYECLRCLASSPLPDASQGAQGSPP